MTFEPVEKHIFTSVRTFRKYPTKFHLVIASIGLDITLDATAHPDQEFMTLLSKPAFWEGRVSRFPFLCVYVPYVFHRMVTMLSVRLQLNI
jgi:predicted secreted hydrolase